MKTACNGVPAPAPSSSSVPRARRSRPGGRRRCGARSCRCRRRSAGRRRRRAIRSASMIMPGAGAVGRQAAGDRACGSGRAGRTRSPACHMRGRLAAGDDQAVDASRVPRRGGPGPRDRADRSSARRCSRTSPCRASTPMRGPWRAAVTSRARRSAGRPGSVVDVDADHRLAEAAGDLGDHVGVVVERGRLDDRGGALGRVARLEDARADEHALGAELHHHRRVGRGGDAAGGEQHDRQLAGRGDLGDQLVRAPAAPWPRRTARRLGRRGEPADARPGSCACAWWPRRRRRCRPRPWSGSSPRPRRSGAAPRRGWSRRRRTGR